MMMRMSIVIVALLYSVSAQAICQPARTWTDGGVTYDAKCMHRLGPSCVHNSQSLSGLGLQPDETGRYLFQARCRL